MLIAVGEFEVWHQAASKIARSACRWAVVLGQGRLRGWLSAWNWGMGALAGARAAHLHTGEYHHRQRVWCRLPRGKVVKCSRVRGMGRLQVLFFECLWTQGETKDVF